MQPHSSHRPMDGPACKVDVDGDLGASCTGGCSCALATHAAAGGSEEECVRSSDGGGHEREEGGGAVAMRDRGDPEIPDRAVSPSGPNNSNAGLKYPLYSHCDLLFLRSL